jgi:rare lipoprotein A (peptidoglycan hydrolase)
VTPRLAQREIALAGIALLAAVVAVALKTGHSETTTKAPKPAGSWYTALAGPRGSASLGKKTACDQKLTADTVGVGDPVLPCGAKIFVSYGDRRVLTQVVDRGPRVPGRRFDLTDALAVKLGIRGVRQVEWAYAGTE